MCAHVSCLATLLLLTSPVAARVLVVEGSRPDMLPAGVMPPRQGSKVPRC